MTIEFSCSHCNKVLKTSDDKAGRRAKCPQCGEPIDVPPLESVASDDDGFAGFDEPASETPASETPASETPASETPVSETPVSEEQSFLADSPVREEESFLAKGDTDCPMCGTSVPAGSSKCQACGETLKASSRSDHWEPRIISSGEVFSRSWEIFKENLGMVIAAPILAYFLMFACIIGVYIVVLGVGFAGLAIVGQNNQEVLIPMAILLYVVTLLALFLIQFYFLLGIQSFLLQVTKGQDPGLGEIFSCGPFLGRMFLCSLVFGILVTIGFYCLVIPGIILSLMFWPYSFLLIDRNLPGIDSFTQVRKVTKGNLLSIFLIFLASAGIFLLGTVLTLGIGLIFLIPFLVLVQTVTYAEMTSQ